MINKPIKTDEKYYSLDAIKNIKNGFNILPSYPKYIYIEDICNELNIFYAIRITDLII